MELEQEQKIERNYSLNGLEQENLKLQQLVFQQKREKIVLSKKVMELEQKNKSYVQHIEACKKKIEGQEQTNKQLKDHIAKSENIIHKLNSIIKQLIKSDESVNYDNSQFAPKTDQKSNKFNNQEYHNEQQQALRKKKDQYYQEEMQKVEQNEQIVQQYYKKKLSNDKSHADKLNKLPPISEDRPMAVQVLKSQLKRINPQELIHHVTRQPQDPHVEEYE